MPGAISIEQKSDRITYQSILRTWWPLAASWLLMGAEGPALFAVMNRLAEPKLNLAAYNGIVYPLALIVESPIIMLLAASTALSKDWASYRKLYRFMMATSAVLTGVHILVAFTPLYDLVVRTVMGAPPEIAGPGRIGLMIMVPWTWSIAYRRFHQGVLIRFGHSRAVGLGAVIRLSADGLVLVAGYLVHTLPGIVVGSAAVIAGVITEAGYAGWVVRPVLRNELRAAPAVADPVTLRSFLRFYIPLVFTSLLGLLVQPIGSAGLNRMPQAISSQAVWGVVNSLVFMFRSAGYAYNETVVALLDEPGSVGFLRRFTHWMSGLVMLLFLVMAVTPLAHLYFRNLQGLDPELARLATLGIWLTIPIPALNVYLNWYQGAILHSRRTRAITEAVVLFLVVAIGILAGGVIHGRITGLFVGLIAFTAALLAQTGWLWFRSRPALEFLSRREIT